MNSIFSTLSGLVQSVAPALATALLGPLGGTAVTALESCFGLAPGAGADQITKVIQGGGMTPEIVAKVREADQKHAEVMAQQQIDVKKLNQDFVLQLAGDDVSDRASARSRQAAVKDRTPAVLAGLVMISAMALGTCVVTGYVTKDPLLATQVGIVIGYVFSEVKSVLAYYFGSSASSSAKDETISKIATAPSE